MFDACDCQGVEEYDEETGGFREIVPAAADFDAAMGDTMQGCGANGEGMYPAGGLHRDNSSAVSATDGPLWYIPFGANMIQELSKPFKKPVQSLTTTVCVSNSCLAL